MNCTFCGKYQSQQSYDTHITICSIINNKSGHTFHDEFNPNKKDMFKLIQYILYENKRLREEINKLKIVNRRTPKSIHIQAPTITFSNWIKEFQVEYRHLEKVFQRDVYDGIKLCILDRIQDEQWENIPIHIHREPKHKRTQIYIYDLTMGIDHPETKWIICDNKRLKILMNSVYLKLEIRFLEWDAQHVPATIEEKEQYNNNLLKIEGTNFRRHIDQYCVDLRTALVRIVTRPGLVQETHEI
jgi:hypothetical protein